ncbi:MAG: hypothetical protein LUD17_06380 [Bacteroidales bacterium]|nr:hypothetical protein [Bacteroidales bacterium]
MTGMPPVRVMRQLLMFKDYCPHRFRFWIVIVFILFYQFTGGVYAASITQIVGELAYISADVTMASYCSLVGLNIIFPMLFRWKFYFFTRQMFFVSSIGCLCCSVLAMYCTNQWIFWIICYLCGYFKMMGMFSCVSTIQLNMTPTRSFGVFLPVIYIFVCGAVMLSGVVSTWVDYFTNWKLMYLVIVVMMMFIDAIVYFMMKPDHRSGPFVPLKGVDWIGQLLWSATAIGVVYIFNFGEHYDWWDGQEIWNATWITLGLLAVTLIWSRFKKDPYIPLAAFGYRITWYFYILFLGFLLTAGAIHIIQPAYVSAVLGYDTINAIDLNYPELLGIVAGGIFAYYMIIRLKWSLRQMLFATFTLLMIYDLGMYFIVQEVTEKIYMYVPVFCYGIVECTIDTLGTYAMSQRIPWPHFFCNISILGFMRCGPGTALGAAILERLFQIETTKATADLASNLDAISGNASEFSRLVTTHALPVAMKECYGWMCYATLIVLLIVLISNYKMTVTRLVPRLVGVARQILNPATAPDPTTTP